MFRGPARKLHHGGLESWEPGGLEARMRMRDYEDEDAAESYIRQIVMGILE